jgi:DNA-binding NarL/FixJ family response regulator
VLSTRGTQPIRVAVIDDHPEVLRALEEWLRSLPSIKVVGAYRSALTAINELPSLSPDLVLVDANMPDLSGLDAVLPLKTGVADIRVVIMSLSDAQVAAARQVPLVDGVLHKEALMDQFPALAARLCGRDSST